jgi:hypothetical protein
MVTKAQHRYHILQAVDEPREQRDEMTSKYLPYERPLRKDELVEVVLRVWEVTGATMPDEGREAFEDLAKTGIRSSIAEAIHDFEYWDEIEEREDIGRVVDRDGSMEFSKRELRQVREPLDFPDRWVDGEYVGPPDPDYSRELNRDSRVAFVVNGSTQMVYESLDAGDEVGVKIEPRDGGDVDDA